MKRNLIIPFVFIVSLLISFNSYSQSNTITIGDSVKYEVQGMLISKNNDIIAIQLSDTEHTPKVNTEGTLSKYFDKLLFGWLIVGNMKVISVNKEIITLKILEEKSPITLSGKKQDYFEPGFSVKFTWTEIAK